MVLVKFTTASVWNINFKIKLPFIHINWCDVTINSKSISNIIFSPLSRQKPNKNFILQSFIIITGHKRLLNNSVMVAALILLNSIVSTCFIFKTYKPISLRLLVIIVWHFALNHITKFFKNIIKFLWIDVWGYVFNKQRLLFFRTSWLSIQVIKLRNSTTRTSFKFKKAKLLY